MQYHATSSYEWHESSWGTYIFWSWENLHHRGFLGQSLLGSRFIDFLWFVEITNILHWNMGRKGIYEVQDRMVSHFAFQGGSELVRPTRLKVMGSAGIRDLHNGEVMDFFPNGEGRHDRVLRLLDSCCGNFVLGAHSVGNSRSGGVVGRCGRSPVRFLAYLETSQLRLAHSFPLLRPYVRTLYRGHRWELPGN